MRPAAFTRGVSFLVLACLATAWLGGCGGHAAAPNTILTGEQQNVSFSAVREAVDKLYAHDPAVRSFTVRSVEYTPRTRDQVLAVCRRGGAASNAHERETSRISACAPLIFFYYEYGRKSSVPMSLDLARKIYWYAVANITGPFEAKAPLTALLTGWGVK